ncbi:VWA domain-containing protein [Intrasporangium sp. DVR]|uniref:VWA domain-containing protein n=1 Tax=Intrasporangium sp. DVR TaxID=3127867 RepID=UPI00313A699A
MSFGQPLLLVVLLAAPVLLAAYVWQLRRRRRRTVRYSSVALVRAVAGRNRSWRRHLPIALVLAALALLGTAAARPQIRTDVPVSGTTILLALDVSGSMCATDVDPNRLTAAQLAVRDFVEAQPREAKLGLVVFSGFAQVAVAPTTDRGEILTALDGVTTGRGTTIGAAILTAIDAIAELDPNVPPSEPVEAVRDPDPGGAPPMPPVPPPDPNQPRAAPLVRAEPVPEIIVLLTDGANTRGATPAQAAEQAAARGVRVYPIGFGTTNPTTLACSRQQYGGFEPGRSFGFGSPGGGSVSRNFLVVDEPALRDVAETTGGEYFSATDAAQLSEVLTDLPEQVTRQRQDVDLSAGFVAIAGLLLGAGLVLSIRWSTLT